MVSDAKLCNNVANYGTNKLKSSREIRQIETFNDIAVQKYVKLTRFFLNFIFCFKNSNCDFREIGDF